MKDIIIDPSGRRKPLLDYLVVTNEPDFLHNFCSDCKLWIKGEKLAQWARRFYENRNVSVNILMPPETEIERILKISVENFTPGLIEKILEIIDNSPEPKQIELAEILKCLTIQQEWKQKPGWEHLLGILFLEFQDLLMPLVEAIVVQWENLVSDNDLKILYRQWFEDREALIEDWLGISEDVPSWRKKNLHKPDNIPDKWLDKYKDFWKKAIIDSEGQKLSGIDSGSQYSMEIISGIAYDYFIKRRDTYKREYLQVLSHYLAPAEKKTLEDMARYRRALEPFPIGSKIDDLDKVFKWCIHYTEHKRFNLCKGYGIEENYHSVSVDFAKWFLDNYLNFRNKPVSATPLNIRVQDIVSNCLSEKQVFWVIIDGLGYWEHRYLLEQICENPNKLKITKGPIPLFSVAPSITSVAKWSLITGKFKSEAEHSNEPLIPDCDQNFAYRDGDIPPTNERKVFLNASLIANWY